MKTDIDYARLFTTITDWETVGSDTQYKIIEEPDETIIVFAESNSAIDWRTNFKFPKKPYKQMDTTFYVHGGFLKEWKLINDLFIDYIESKLNMGFIKKITIVGWSYGGAMATLCMEDLWYNFPALRDSTILMTFGSPRVIGAYHYNKVIERWNGTIRYVNGSDIVTCVPFPFMGFRHIKEETHIGKKKNLFRFLFPKKNHEISCYIASLDSKGSSL